MSRIRRLRVLRYDKAFPPIQGEGSMTTRLYFVRHGATPRTAENRFSGAAGVDHQTLEMYEQRLVENLQCLAARLSSALGKWGHVRDARD